MSTPTHFSPHFFSIHPFTLCFFFFIIDTTHQSRHTSALTLTMGKSDEKKTKNRPHKATDGENKHKKQTSFDTLRSSPFETPFKDTDAATRRHSQWRDNFRQLCEFKVQFGHCLVPNRYSINPKLGQWVASQRARYKKNTKEKSSSMSAEHIRALDGIGFDWGASKTDVASIWSVRFQQLCEFKATFGHCIVPSQYSANNKLGWWAASQRCHRRSYLQGKPSRMTAERIQALDGIGFDWGTSKTDPASIWSLRLQQMREFKIQFGHCLVPQRYSANPQLVWWVSKQRYQRRLYQEGKPSRITLEYIRALDGIGFDWGTSKTDLASIWSVRF
jgi:hypothetical protein